MNLIMDNYSISRLDSSLLSGLRVVLEEGFVIYFCISGELLHKLLGQTHPDVGKAGTFPDNKLDL